MSVPVLVPVPKLLNHPAPLRIIKGTFAKVSTLFKRVGFCHNPFTAGNGGLGLGSPLLPSIEVIRAVSSPHTKQVVVKKLFKQNPSNYELRCIIEYTDYKTRAWKQLLKQNPSINDMSYIIEHTDYKQQAWEHMLRQEPTGEDLGYIVKYTDYKQQAWEQLKKQDPSNRVLNNILDYCSDMKINKQVIEYLKKWSTTINTT
jgi:hypothetical protein